MPDEAEQTMPEVAPDATEPEGEAYQKEYTQLELMAAMRPLKAGK